MGLVTTRFPRRDCRRIYVQPIGKIVVSHVEQGKDDAELGGGINHRILSSNASALRLAARTRSGSAGTEG